jgi:hypothetical protein
VAGRVRGLAGAGAVLAVALTGCDSTGGSALAMGEKLATPVGDLSADSGPTQLVTDSKSLNRARILFPGTHTASCDAEQKVGVVAPFAYSRVIPGSMRVVSGGSSRLLSDTLQFAVLVGPDGRVQDAEPLVPIAPMLASRGRDALMQWRFRPGTVDGRSETFVVVVALAFGQT